MLSVGAGRIVWLIFLSSIISLSFSLPLGIGPILTEILSHWAIKSYNHFPPSLRTFACSYFSGNLHVRWKRVRPYECFSGIWALHRMDE